MVNCVLAVGGKVAKMGEIETGTEMSAPSEDIAKSPLDAAQKIVADLEGMASEQQLLALKFAMETLGLKFSAASASVVPAQPIVAALQPMQQSPAGGSGHSTDIRAFTAQKAPKSDQQFTAVVAYFYQLEAKPEERKDSIDADVMKEAARLANWPQVQRWNMTLTNAKNAGYLDAAGAGSFKLSSVGENLVAITLPGNAAPGGKKVGKKIAKKKKAGKKG